MAGWRLWLLMSTLTLTASAAAQDSLSAKLEPLRPLLGNTWKGRFLGADSSRALVDIARWERVLNGKGVRLLHSDSDGTYGGETIITWDSEKECLVYSYFTTAGFSTSGTMRVEGNRMLAHEAVRGNANGITEVRSTTEILPQGKYHVKAEYVKDGTPVGSREVMYTEDPSAQVIFR